MYGFAQLKIFANARMAQVESSIVKSMVEGIARVTIFQGSADSVDGPIPGTERNPGPITRSGDED